LILHVVKSLPTERDILLKNISFFGILLLEAAERLANAG